MRHGVSLLGNGGAPDYMLVHDPDDDSLTLSIDGFVVARRGPGAKACLDHLDGAVEGAALGFALPSVSDELVRFHVVADGTWLVLMSDDEELLAGMDESAAMVEFLASAMRGI